MADTVATLGTKDRIILAVIALVLGGTGSAIGARTIDARVAVLESKVIDPVNLEHRLSGIEIGLALVYKAQTGLDLPGSH